MKSFLITVLGLLVSFHVQCQNLVPNPGFENCTREVNNWIGNYRSFGNAIENWSSPNEGSPDILQRKFIGNMFIKRPKVNLSPYQPRNGDVILGLKLYGCEGGAHCKEYIQTELTQALEKGKKYHVSFWVKSINNSIKINNIGACLTEEKLEKYKAGIYNVVPQLNHEKVIDIDDNQTWLQISDTICANQNYQFLTIGNFHYDDETEITEVPDGLNYAFYLIDDIEVKDIKENCDGSKIIEIAKVINVQNIQFELDSSDLTSSSYPELDKLVFLMNDNPTMKIQIIGHTDNQGDASHNQTLSSDRALSVGAYLQSQGISEEVFKTEGKGDSYPIADNSTEEGRKLNRRVEIKIQ